MLLYLILIIYRLITKQFNYIINYPLGLLIGMITGTVIFLIIKLSKDNLSWKWNFSNIAWWKYLFIIITSIIFTAGNPYLYELISNKKFY